MSGERGSHMPATKGIATGFVYTRMEARALVAVLALSLLVGIVSALVQIGTRHAFPPALSLLGAAAAVYAGVRLLNRGRARADQQGWRGARGGPFRGFGVAVDQSDWGSATTVWAVLGVMAATWLIVTVTAVVAYRPLH